MSIDYIVSSLPALSFGAPAPLSPARLRETCGGVWPDVVEPLLRRDWADLDVQLRNAIAEARGGERYRRPARGCSQYWRSRVLACFQESDVMRREEFLDRVRWDAAGELTQPADPLGPGALATYAVRLEIIARRDRISAEAGGAAFDRLTAGTRAPKIGKSESVKA